jgi:Gas vesicle protein
MSDPGRLPPRRVVPHGVVRSDLAPRPEGPANLADILERVLDKGIVIAGDIQVNLLDIELLTIKIRLLIASVDRAKEMGINWWESDPTLTAGAEELVAENEDLRARLDRLEQHLALVGGSDKDAQTEQVEVTEEARTTVDEKGGRKSTEAAKTVTREERRR